MKPVHQASLLASAAALFGVFACWLLFQRVDIFPHAAAALIASFILVLGFAAFAGQALDRRPVSYSAACGNAPIDWAAVLDKWGTFDLMTRALYCELASSWKHCPCAQLDRRLPRHRFFEGMPQDTHLAAAGAWFAQWLRAGELGAAREKLAFINARGAELLQ